MATGTAALGYYDVVVSGKYAFVSASSVNVIHTFNISDPSSITIVNYTSSCLLNPRRMALSGDSLYVHIGGDNASKILTYKLTNVNAMTTDFGDIKANKGNFTDYLSAERMNIKQDLNVGAMATVGTLSTNWLVSNSGMISGTLSKITNFPLGNTSSLYLPLATGLTNNKDMDIQGKYAVMVGDDSLVLIDISNPAAPTLASTLDRFTSSLFDSPVGVWIQGKYIYVTSRDNNSFGVIDFSNVLTGTMTVASTITTNLNAPQGIYIQGKYAYVASFGNDSLVEIDISNPNNLVCTSTIKSATSLDGANRIFVSGKTAFVACSNADDLAAIDISNPASLSITSTIHPSNADTSTLLDGAYDVYVSGKYAYVTAPTNDMLVVIDVSNPSTMSVTSSIAPIIGTSTIIDNPQQVYVTNKYAYVSATTAGRIGIFDVSNPSTLSLTSTLSPGVGCVSLVLNGKYLHTSSAYSGFNTYELSNVDIQNIETGNLRATSANITDYAQVGQLSVVDGLNVGKDIYASTITGLSLAGTILAGPQPNAINFVSASGTFAGVISKIQSGSYTIIAGSTNLGFPSTFAGVPYVVLTPYTTSTATWQFSVSDISTSSFTVNSDTAGTIMWHAHSNK
jgi:hypothetical protein